MLCRQCKREFESKRSTAKYCSAKCRKLAFQTVSVPVSVPAPFAGVCNGKPTVDLLLGPLDIYSEQRWSFLQSRGHKWDADRQRSFRPGPNGTEIMGVTVPGDPAYASQHEEAIA